MLYLLFRHKDFLEILIDNKRLIGSNIAPFLPNLEKQGLGRIIIAIFAGIQEPADLKLEILEQ